MLKLAENGYTDIIIYVLIMVGGLVVNAYRNYAKKKELERRAERPPSEQKPIFPEVVFEPIFEYDQPEPEVVFESEAEILDAPQSEIDKPLSENIPAPSYTEGEAVFGETVESLASERHIPEVYIDDEDLTTVKFFEEEKETKKSKFEFNVAQAVIYSEILKPKYF